MCTPRVPQCLRSQDFLDTISSISHLTPALQTYTYNEPKGIFPLIFTLCWRGQTRLAAIISPILGFATGVAIWLATAKKLYGSINLTTTEAGYPALYGACGSLFSPILYSVLISQYKPYKFDWREFLRVELAEEVKTPVTPPSELEDEDPSPANKAVNETVRSTSALSPIEKAVLRDPEHTAAIEEKSTVVSTTGIPPVVASSSTSRNVSLDDIRHPFSEETLQELYRWYKIAWIIFIVIVLVTFIAWPLPLYRNYIFSKSFFTGWVTVAIIWTFFAFFAVVVYPLYDGRHAIAKGASGAWKALRVLLGGSKKQ